MTSGGAAGSGGPAPAATGAPPGKTVPRDIVVMQAMLRELGINRFDPRILCQMHEYVYRYITSVAEEARVCSVYAKRKSIDVDDVKLAVKLLGGKHYTTVPPRDLLLDLAKTKNSIPLPLLKATSGLRLPPDRFCLTQPNYRLQFFRKSIASSNFVSGSRQPTPLNASTNQPLFKTPSGLPLRTVVLSGTGGGAGEPESKKPKLS